ncbi:MAG: acyl-CoA/acyl-ACP dehydrogenase [Gammaproteobacteria bacterium]|nr:acyl-CoA/acyl-ACP dehydrogenase [Gammaproteobacteria bacterium]
MNFEFSQEQDLLREQARGFLDENCSPSAVRKILEGPESYDAKLWQAIAKLGWMATVVPEEFGGLGLSYYELSVIAEELGRAVAPIPFSSSVYLATEALLLAGNASQRHEWLPKLATGEAIGTFAFAEKAGRPSPTNLTTTATGNSLSGTKIAVPDGDIADFAIVVARSDTGDGASAYLVELDEVAQEKLNGIDPTRSHVKLRFEKDKAELVGSEGTGWNLVNQLLNRAAILFAWEQVGGSQAALEQAKEYAMGRYAFGRPIAGFQAIKHKLANVYVKNSLARSNCYFGAWALAGDESDLPLAAATARVSASQAYYFASKENIQTHGGMGFTWEFDCQLYYRRAKLLSVNLGSEMWWQDRLISAYEQRNQPVAA